MLCEVSGVTPAWSSVPCLGNGAVIHGLGELSQWSESGESGTGESCLQRLHLLFLALPHPNPWQPRKCGLSSGYLSALPTGAASMLQAPSSAVGSHQLYDCIDFAATGPTKYFSMATAMPYGLQLYGGY